MDKPMNSSHTHRRTARFAGFLTYISTIRGKSAKTAHSIILICGCFFAYSSTTKAQSINLPADEIDISDIDLDFIRDITLSDTMIIWNTWRRAAQHRQNNLQPHQLRVECQLACTQDFCDTRIFSVFDR